MKLLDTLVEGLNNQGVDTSTAVPLEPVVSSVVEEVHRELSARLIKVDMPSSQKAKTEDLINQIMLGIKLDLHGLT